MAQHLLFDLDGTLIDSSASILASFSAALTISGIEPAVSLSPALIGPPVRQTLARIAGSDDPDLIDRLFHHFRQEYDKEGYRKTLVYPGIDTVLRGLAKAGKSMYIVTNKRAVPTLLIMDMFGWTGLFKSIHALDAGSHQFAGKSDLVGHLIDEHSMDSADVMLIGDTAEDSEAAHQNNLRFYGVAWGYGGLTPSNNMRVLETPADILAL